jgi:ABC-type transport system involved in Fe-S cluster assembly fused permease/ATPase subunit
MQFFTRKTRGCNILFNSANIEIFSVLSVPMIMWQETTVKVKKKVLPPFVIVNALLFSMRAPTRKHSVSWKIIDSSHQSRPNKEILFS